MSDSTKSPDSVDILIRRLLLGGATFVVLGGLATAVVIAFAISMNFRLMSWLE